MDKKKIPRIAKGKYIESGEELGTLQPETSMMAGAGSSVEPLTSFAIFDLCVERAQNLVKLHEAAHRKARQAGEVYCRCPPRAIVLAISALDAFICDFVMFRTRQLLASKSHSLPAALAAHIKKFLKDDDLLKARPQR